MTWRRRPTGEELERLYPPAARDRSIEGKATVRCVVAADGRLGNCIVLSETPAGMGFGDASVRAAELMEAEPTRPGTIIEGRAVAVPFVWKLDETPTPPTIWEPLQDVWVRKGQRCFDATAANSYILSETGISFPGGVFGRVVADRMEPPDKFHFELRLPDDRTRRVLVILDRQARFITLRYDAVSVVLTRCRRPEK